MATTNQPVVIKRKRSHGGHQMGLGAESRKMADLPPVELPPEPPSVPPQFPSIPPTDKGARECKSFWLKLLDFLEHPLLLWAAGILAGIVAYFIYPVLAICGICVMLAFHRAKVVEGWPLRRQIASYAILFALTTASLLGIGILIKRRIPQLATVSDIRELLRPTKADIAAEIQKNKPPEQGTGKDTVKPPAAPAADPFTGKVDVQLSSVPTRSTPFALLKQGIAACSITPIQSLMFIRFTNTSPHPKLVTEYKIDVGNSQTDKWDRLSRINLRTGYLISFAEKPNIIIAPPVGHAIDWPSGDMSHYGFLVSPKNGNYDSVAVLNGQLLDHCCPVKSRTESVG
jgi:hypothetical protein